MSEPEDRFTRLLLSLCTWPRMRNPIDASGFAEPAVWGRALGLARIHALSPILYAAARESCLPVALPEPDSLRRAYYVRAARAALALEELRECAHALNADGLRCIVLKGAASMLSVYSDPALRVISDLDILVPLEDLPRCVDALKRIGYWKAQTTTSREDEWLSVMYFDGVSMYRPDSLPIELHCSFLGGSGNPEAATAEAWEMAVPLADNGPMLMGLCPEHAFITAACHLHRNYHRSLPYLKDVADMVLLAGRIDERNGWDALWQACRRWKVEREVGGVAAFLNRYLPVSLPVFEGAAPPFTPADLVYALERLEGRGRLTEGLTARIRLMGRLPSWQARLRFLMGMVVPCPDFLRWRYHITDDRSLAPYYARHVLKAIRRTAQDAVLRSRQRSRAARRIPTSTLSDPKAPV